MDEFDTALQEAHKKNEPRKDFVETTMSKVRTTSLRKKRAMKLWIPSAAIGAALVIAAILILPVLRADHTPATTNVQTQTSTQPSATSRNTTPAAGTDNSSLQSDLNGINGSMNQESSDQNNADSSLNDSSQQVSVPTS